MAGVGPASGKDRSRDDGILASSEAPGGMTGIILPILSSGWSSMVASGISKSAGGNGAQGTGRGRGLGSGGTGGGGRYGTQAGNSGRGPTEDVGGVGTASSGQRTWGTGSGGMGGAGSSGAVTGVDQGQMARTAGSSDQATSNSCPSCCSASDFGRAWGIGLSSTDVIGRCGARVDIGDRGGLTAANGGTGSGGTGSVGGSGAQGRGGQCLVVDFDRAQGMGRAVSGVDEGQTARTAGSSDLLGATGRGTGSMESGSTGLAWTWHGSGARCKGRGCMTGAAGGIS